MKPKSAAPDTVDQYIASFPRGVQAVLRKIRATIRKAAPNAEERISYRMPGSAVRFLDAKLSLDASWTHAMGDLRPRITRDRERT